MEAALCSSPSLAGTAEPRDARGENRRADCRNREYKPVQGGARACCRSARSRRRAKSVRKTPRSRRPVGPSTHHGAGSACDLPSGAGGAPACRRSFAKAPHIQLAAPHRAKPHKNRIVFESFSARTTARPQHDRRVIPAAGDASSGRALRRFVRGVRHSAAAWGRETSCVTFRCGVDDGAAGQQRRW